MTPANRPLDVAAGDVGANAVKSAAIRARGIALGLLLVVIISFIVSYAELVTARILIGSQQLPPAVIAVFALIVLANKGLRRLSRRLRLSARDHSLSGGGSGRGIRRPDARGDPVATK